MIGSVVDVGEEEAARVVLQGGLKATISCMNTYPSNKPIQRMCLTIFHRLSRDPDHLVIMAAENVIPPLRNAKEKYSTDADVSWSGRGGGGVGFWTRIMDYNGFDQISRTL